MTTVAAQATFRDAVVDALDAYRNAMGPDDPNWERYQACLDMAVGSEAAEGVAIQFLRSDEPAKKHLAMDLCIVLAKADPERFERHAPAVMEAAADENDVALRGSAVTALGAMRSQQAVPFLLGSLDGSSADLRAASTLALSACAVNSEAAMRAAIAAMIDSDPSVRMCAALGLSSQLENPPKEVLDALATRLFDPDASVWDEAVIGLARHGDQRGVEALRAAIEGSRASERMQTAARRLGLA